MEGSNATRRRQAGFTLVELMVSLALLLLLSVYLTQMLVNQSQAYAVIDRVTETQQNVRTVASLLERELRATGLLVPEAAAVCGVDRVNDSDVLFVTDTNAIDDPTILTTLGLGVDVTGGYNGTGAETLQLSGIALDAPTYDTDGDGAADADFVLSAGPGPARNGGVIVADRANPGRGSSCGIVTAVDYAGNEISVDFDVAGNGGSQLSGGGANPPELVAVPAHVYQVQNGELLRNGMALADDVEDLQVAYFFDTDGDLEEDAPGETPGAGGSPLPAQYDPTLWDHSTLKEVRVNLVARTRVEDTDALQNPGRAQGTFQITENRAAPGNPADGFRRRVHTASVRPRNVGRRPLGSP